MMQWAAGDDGTRELSDIAPRAVSVLTTRLHWSVRGSQAGLPRARCRTRRKMDALLLNALSLSGVTKAVSLTS